MKVGKGLMMLGHWTICAAAVVGFQYYAIGLVAYRLISGKTKWRDFVPDSGGTAEPRHMAKKRSKCQTKRRGVSSRRPSVSLRTLAVGKE